jgi:hypothetical protein
MRLNRNPLAKLQAARAAWQSFHPRSVISHECHTRNEFDFLSTRTVGVGAKSVCYVRVVKFDDSRCAMIVQMRLQDKRVATLLSKVMAYDMMNSSVCVLDVMPASSVIKGEEPPGLTMINSNCSVQEFSRFVEDYSRRIDCIWQSVGGCSV